MVSRAELERTAEVANRIVRQFLYDERINWYRLTDDEVEMVALYARRRHLAVLRRRALDCLAKRRRKEAQKQVIAARYGRLQEDGPHVAGEPEDPAEAAKRVLAEVQAAYARKPQGGFTP